MGDGKSSQVLSFQKSLNKKESGLLSPLQLRVFWSLKDFINQFFKMNLLFSYSHVHFLTFKLVPRQRIISQLLAALAASFHLYGDFRPPFSPKWTMVSLRGFPQLWHERSVLCRLTPVFSVTSNSRTYSACGLQWLQT